MKKALKIEFQKLKASRLFWMALTVGIVIGGLQVFNNMTWVNHVLKYSHDDVQMCIRDSVYCADFSGGCDFCARDK